MCGEDGAQKEVYKLKEEPEKGIGREKERKEREKERERERRKEREKKSNNWKPRTFSRVTFGEGRPELT